MKSLQVVIATAVVAALATAACNRADSRDHARVAAAEVKEVAERAGEKLADSWLATKIQAQYFADDDVKARNILVTARNGVVTLKGRVDDADAHDQALQIARTTDGVRQVDDQLTLESGVPATRTAEAAAARSTGAVATSGFSATAPAGGPPDDAGITARIQARYFMDPSIKARRIEVDTKQGVVTLRGELASDNERAQSLILARTTEGVQRVEDALTVNAGLAQPLPSSALGPALASPGVMPITAHPEDAGLTADLEAKFAADRLFAKAAVDITAKDGVVLLEGTVPTAGAKRRALDLARDTKGVVQVVDRLKVVRSR